MAMGNEPPTVWEKNPARAGGATGYGVIDPEQDSRRDYRSIYDVSGDANLLDSLIGRIAPGGEIVLAGFYSDRLSFSFPPAFMREARLRISAEFTPADTAATIALIDTGTLRLDGLISHARPAAEATDAYPQAFTDPAMLDPGPLREEASHEPDPVPTGPVTKETQIIAIYGKGGSGKSFALANLSYMMAQQGKRVLLIGCDPKSDTTSLLFGGKSTPTIIETSSRKKLAGEEIGIEDVCFQRDGVFAMELGGPEVGRGCGGRGIIHGFETLEKLGFHEWGFDYVLLDFLGDVVCGGFGLPIARDMCQKVIVVGSNDLQSLYVANNVCKA
eukprot:gene5768-7812_t